MSQAVVIKTTLSPCPQCRSLLSAELLKKNGNVYLRRHCPEHGEQEHYYAKNASLFSKFLALTDDAKAQPGWHADLNAFPYVRGVCVDLTTRCNLPCPTCFADANRSKNWEPTPDEISERLKGFSAHKPVVFLIGGEPTLYKELPEVIRRLVAEGYTPKLVTNGLKIADDAYLGTLQDAGLRWVILQFDGFRKDTSISYRSRDLRSYKEKAIENMARRGMNILLACMVMKGINDDELGEVVRYAARHPRIHQVALLPASTIGRQGAEHPEAETMMDDVFEGLKAGTGAQVTGEDFLAFMRVYRVFWRLTRVAGFYPKTCLTSIVLHFDGKNLVPLNRLLNPLNWLRYPRAFLAVLRHGWRIPWFEDWDDKRGFMIIDIEKFRSTHNFDWKDAHGCAKVYLRKEGWALACMHNAFTRNDYYALEYDPEDGPAPSVLRREDVAPEVLAAQAAEVAREDGVIPV